MDSWDTDNRTEKERFFDSLYSISQADSDDTLETSNVTLLLATSRGQRNIVPGSIIRRSRASTAIPQVRTAPAIGRASTMPIQKSREMTLTAPLTIAPTAHASPPRLISSLPQPSVPAIVRASAMPIQKSGEIALTASITIAPTARTSLSPQPTSPPSPPPESSRILNPLAVGKAGKRKKVMKPAPSTKMQLFKDLYFYFIPNDLKNPARKLRVQRTGEHGGFCLNEWREKNITHVVVDAWLKYEDVLKYLRKEKIPDHIAVVNETFIGDCLDFRRVVDPGQAQYKVPGHGTAPPVSSSQQTDAISPSTNPYQNKPTGSRRGAVETPHSTQLFSSIPYSTQSRHSEVSQTDSDLIQTEAPGASSAASQIVSEQRALEELTSKRAKITAVISDISSPMPQPTFEHRVMELMSETSRTKDDLDLMIDEALGMGDLPLLDDDDDFENRYASADSQDTDEEESFTRAKKAKLMSKRTKAEKAGGWQETFQCMQRNDGMSRDWNLNRRTIEVLCEMQKYYEMTKDQWRSISYRKAVNTLRKQTKKIIFASEAKELINIGPSIAEKIEEIVRTNHLKKLDYTKLEPTDMALKLFLGVYGVGPSLAHQWAQNGYKSLDDLRTNVKLSESQRIGVDHYEDFNCRILREEVKRHGDVVMEIAALIDPALELEVLGSYRRGAKDCGDIDIMITKKGADAHWLSGLLDELVERLYVVGFLQCGLAIPRGRHDGSKWHGASKVSGVPQWRRIDLLVVPWDERGAALLYFTGNDIFNRSMRLLASKKGYRLNQRGLYKDVMRGPQKKKITDGTKVGGQDEKRIFEILGVPYRAPEERIC